MLTHGVGWSAPLPNCSVWASQHPVGEILFEHFFVIRIKLLALLGLVGHSELEWHGDRPLGTIGRVQWSPEVEEA